MAGRVLIIVATYFILHFSFVRQSTVTATKILKEDSSETTSEDGNNAEINYSEEIEITTMNPENLTKEEVNGSKPFRLPVSLIPYNYKLEIIPVLDELPTKNENSSLGTVFKKFHANGKVWISVNCTESTNNVTLHASDIEINNSSIKVKNLETGIEEIIENFTADNETDFFIISLKNETKVGVPYEIQIEFVSRIADDRLNGMYLDYYIDPATKKKNYLATTLFAPFHARKAFPCYDEPSMRATFEITVGRSEKHHALSNAERIATEEMNGTVGWYWDKFATSPKISTYIVAIIVSDFKYIELNQIGMENHTTNIRVFAPENLIESQAGNFGVNITKMILTDFETHFEVGFPIKKLYSVALPHFFFNAMENWGLITYKDPVILNVPNVTTEKEKFRICYVASHEIAHQWFGNLVSVKFWTYVWLKEAFATYYGFRGINLVLPEFKPWTQFTHQALQLALDFDAGPDTHPMDNEPKNSSAVADIYSRIPYEKGGSILRMTASFLTEETFQAGIKKYIQKMKYKSADPDDLYEALQDAADEDGTLSANATVKEILTTWTQQTGFPLLRIAIKNANSLSVTQEKFIGENSLLTRNETLTNKVENEESWWIPITFSPSSPSTNNTDYPTAWMSDKDKNVSVDTDTSQLIAVNPNAVGYFRVLYENPLYDRIRQQLNEDHRKLQPEFRSQLIDDYFHLAFADYVPVHSVFILSDFIDKESDYSVWQTFLNNLDKPYKLLSETKLSVYFKNYLELKISNVLNMDTLSRSEGLDRMLHSLLFKWACKLGHLHSVQYSISELEKWQNNPADNSIIADIQSTVYCTAVKYTMDTTNNTIWNFMLEKYEQESFSVQKYRLLRALSCSTHAHLLKQLLKMTIDTEIDMHDVDRVKIFQNVVDNPMGRALALKFADENFELLYKNVSTANPITECLKSLSTYMSTSEEMQMVEAFIETHKSALESKKKTLDKFVKKIAENIEWVKRFAVPIHTWMETKVLHEK